MGQPTGQRDPTLAPCRPHDARRLGEHEMVLRYYEGDVEEAARLIEAAHV